MILGRQFRPSRLRQLRRAAIISLKTMARPDLQLRHPWMRVMRCRTVAKVVLIGFKDPDVYLPVQPGSLGS